MSQSDAEKALVKIDFRDQISVDKAFTFSPCQNMNRSQQRLRSITIRSAAWVPYLGGRGEMPTLETRDKFLKHYTLGLSASLLSVKEHGLLARPPPLEFLVPPFRDFCGWLVGKAVLRTGLTLAPGNACKVCRHRGITFPCRLSLSKGGDCWVSFCFKASGCTKKEMLKARWHLHRSALRKGGAAQQAWPGLWKGAYEHLDRPQRSWFCRLVVFCCLSHILLLRGGFVPDQC